VDALTEAQRESLRGTLETLERQLDAAHETAAESAGPVDLEEPIGRVSRIDAIAQQSMVQANRASVQRRLQQVRSALRRLDEGEYGLCAACGEEVGFRRLEAQPEAPLCITCQSQRERRG